MKKRELEADTDELICEYRAQLAIQLDAERALKLSKGRNFCSDKSRRESSSSSDEDESRRSRSSS
ncbi:hypothetical protein Bca52824_025116 [Brassica carinata]|uniref:Uncharacterized protein n=1 Tax=Brassica carinata TaxID=52824 RepID=A0A8X7VL96_BRACI|nr:hypothetical protein Bca52824_025116 [Brassica carinata]